MKKLPDFLIIGAMKSGTTLVYDALEQHKQIYFPTEKELHFFSLWNNSKFTPLEASKVRIKYLEEYLTFFSKALPHHIIGEASTSYLYSRQAPSNIKKLIPNCNIFCVLRNPVDRAYSHYLWHVRNGIEKEVNFRKAINLEKKRFEQKSDWGYYLKLGFYFQQLKNYYDVFPKEQISIIIFEEMMKQKVETIQNICSILKVDKNFFPDMSIRRNPSGIPRRMWVNNIFTNSSSNFKKLANNLLPRKLYYLLTMIRDKNLTKPLLSNEIRIQLRDIYYEDILELQKLIKKDLSVWLKVE